MLTPAQVSDNKSPVLWTVLRFIQYAYEIYTHINTYIQFFQSLLSVLEFLFLVACYVCEIELWESITVDYNQEKFVAMQEEEKKTKKKLNKWLRVGKALIVNQFQFVCMKPTPFINLTVENDANKHRRKSISDVYSIHTNKRAYHRNAISN